MTLNCYELLTFYDNLKFRFFTCGWYNGLETAKQNRPFKLHNMPLLLDFQKIELYRHLLFERNPLLRNKSELKCVFKESKVLKNSFKFGRFCFKLPCTTLSIAFNDIDVWKFCRSRKMFHSQSFTIIWLNHPFKEQALTREKHYRALSAYQALSGTPIYQWSTGPGQYSDRDLGSGRPKSRGKELAT